MKKVFSISVAVAMFGLAGCMSGGGGSDDDAVMSPVSGNVSGNDAVNTETAGVKGRYMIAKTGAISQLPPSDKATVITLYGEEFDLVDGIGFGGKLPAYAQFAAAAALVNVQTNELILAHQGDATPTNALPTGQVKYEGVAFAMKNDNVQVTEDLDIEGLAYTIKAKAELTADFDTKNIQGTISNISIDSQKYDNIELAGQIQGNTFSGNNAGVVLDGGFYGPNAAAATGIFKDNNQGLVGGFGTVQEGIDLKKLTP
ncbi:MAG: transferrin-binding protein-like solute binding protein [Cardiobacteriaceae bacterium]|nr:transferrin-binding protein-like solute binding protein [Cardiobacteriaceae bacterium]